MKKREKVLLIVLAVVMVLAGGFWGYQNYWANKSETSQTSTPVKSKVRKVVQEPTSTPTPTLTPLVDEGVTWQEPEKLGDLGLLKASDEVDVGSEFAYYRIAKLTAGGELVLAKSDCGMGGTCFFRFKKDSSGTYNYLVRHSLVNDMNQISKILKDPQKTKTDNQTVYAGISSPDIITTEKSVSLTGPGNMWGDNFFSELSKQHKLEQVATTQYGLIYEVRDLRNNKGIATRVLHLKHADFTYTPYKIKLTFMGDDNVPQVTLSDGSKMTGIYTMMIFSGCGLAYANGMPVLYDVKDIDARLTELGKTTTGDKVYTITNTQDLAISDIYENYKVGREGQSTLTLEQFVAKKPLLVWRDPMGDYITLVNQDYGALAECGKPVIYLYPESKLEVAVEVGAKITKSEPAYVSGWKATALPNGRLRVNGKEYPYLFWEGLGYGEYPDTSKVGFVVKRSELRQALISHLGQLGLNDKEKNDFMDFWWSKMPDTPYVRLTWLGTGEMDRLAPLKVTPKPTTSIRIFLDFEGLSQPINIAPQKLSAPTRKGFTLVEWGGLLKGNK